MIPVLKTHLRKISMVAAVGLAAALAVATVGYTATPPQDPQQPPAAAWGVECGSNGTVLDCSAIMRIMQRDARQQLIPFAIMAVKYAPDIKAAVLQLRLPLGVSVSEPIIFKVDATELQKQTLQSCNNVGCFLKMNINDKLLAALRANGTFKIVVQDSNNKQVEIPVPALGFGLAFDKSK